MNNYSLEVGTNDFERMTLLGNIYKQHNMQFLLDCGLKEGMDVADVGCGPGNMSLWLAEQVGSRGSVTAIDNSEEQLKLLTEQASRHHLKQIHAKKYDIYELTEHFGQQFDLVYSRFLMIHLPDPLKAIMQLKKILKQGGRLILCEVDNETWYSYPKSQSLEKDCQLLAQLGQERKIDITIGKKLYHLFKELAFTEIKVNIAQPVLEKGQRSYLISKVQAWGKKYLEHQLITEIEFEKLLNDIKLLVLNEEYLLLGARMFQVGGLA